jgi:dipeptidyl aminopeptidase/acylaminoacyl peptidase
VVDDITARVLARRAPTHASVRGDGMTLLTTVHVPEGATEVEVALTLLDVGTGDERAVPCALPGDHSAVWAPDGTALAWCSTEGDRPVLRWAADVAAAATIVPGSHGVNGPAAWSPDGKRLAFAAPSREPIDRSKPFRWTSGLLHFDGVGPLDTPPQVCVVDLATGEQRWLTDDRWRYGTIRWAPSGDHLAACAGLDPDGLRSGQHLVLLGLDGSRSEPDVPGGRVVLPVWDADGALTAMVVDPKDRPLGSAAALFRVTANETAPIAVRGLIGGDVYGDHQAELCDVYDSVLLAVADGSFVVRTVRRGRMGIARLEPRTGELAEIVGGDRCCTPVGFAGERLVFTTVSATETAEIATVLLDGGEERRITDFAGGTPPTVHVRRFEVATDAPGPIDAWFVHAPDSTLPLPTVLVVHGGPNFAFGDTFSADVHALCAAGFGVLYANPRGSTGSGDDFTHAAICDWTDGPGRDLFAALDESIERGWSDPDRLGVTGNSYGGYMSAWLASTTDRFRAAVVENPVTDLAAMHAVSDIGTWFFESQFGGKPQDQAELYASQSPLHQAHRCRTPVLWVVGEADRRCPPSQAWAMHRAVLRTGTVSEVLVLPGSSHEGSTYGPPEARLAHDAALVEWMQRWVLA